MILTGLARLGRDASVKEHDGTPLAELTVAYNWGRKSGDSQPTQWIKCTLWGKLAEVLGPYLKKGAAVDLVLEDVHTRAYSDRDGQPAAAMEAKVLKIELASRPPQRDDQDQQPQSRPAPAPRSAPAAAPAARRPLSDDEIPF